MSFRAGASWFSTKTKISQSSGVDGLAGLGLWHLHELRPSGASVMLAQGTDLDEVSKVLGHSSVAITKDVYGHLVEGQKRTAAHLMSAALLREVGSRNGSQTP